MINTLSPVEEVSIITLVDNYTDLLLIENTPTIQRPILPYGQTLFAEHGLSFFIRVSSGNKTHTILMDAGGSTSALLKNTETLGVNLEEIEEIVISHGHFDHIGALTQVLRQSSCRIPVNLHPAAFNSRRKKLPDETYTNLPVMNRDEITHAGAILSLSSDPSLICSQHVLLTGEIERTTSYEKGSPVLEAKEGEQFVVDSFRDDQSVIINLKDQGLVVISGCAHAGIVNSIRYAQKITGVPRIHAIIGGFHLSGPYFSKIITPTITDLESINPAYIIPMHCTGWEAQTLFAKKMPDKFILSTVGTKYVFTAR